MTEDILAAVVLAIAVFLATVALALCTIAWRLGQLVHHWRRWTHTR